ncbi:hypothetical protein SS50377_26265 [Spironucleus salmonicida]|uniref:Transmembrane protein n=1 Tax=Spironucleus salmonicida TaxID=348837 RepID=A0A9P8RX28_9EUKA|nr:hypothetical protein SS50377_26265 [Spironucleus salmonicida]
MSGHFCLQVMSSLFITSQNAYIQLQLLPQCINSSVHLKLYINDDPYLVYAQNKGVTQNISVKIIEYNPLFIHYAKLELIDEQHEHVIIINKIRYAHNLAQSCLNFTDIKISSTQGMLAFYFKSHTCANEVIISKIFTHFILDDGQIMTDLKLANQLQVGQISSFSCKLRTIPDLSIQQRVVFHCCQSNFTCYQIEKNILELKSNQVNLDIVFQINQPNNQVFFSNIKYNNVFLNGFNEVQVQSSKFVIDDMYFIASFLLQNPVGEINNYLVEIQFYNVTLQLTYLYSQDYFILECVELESINEYTQCVEDIKYSKNILNIDPTFNFAVTIFFKDVNNKLLSRYSTIAQITEISHTVLDKHYFHNGIFYIFTTKFVGYDIQATMIGDINQSVTFYGREKNKYSYINKNISKLNNKYDDIIFIIQVQEEGIQIQTRYLLHFNIEPKLCSPFIIYFPITLLMLALSCFFLQPNHDQFSEVLFT